MIVTDTTAQRWSRRRFLGGAVSVAALGPIAAACSAAHPTTSVQRIALTSPTSPASGSGPAAAAAPGGVDAELISRRYAGLKPFAPAPSPVEAITLSASDPTVFSHVPITEKVVFVTIDDGIEGVLIRDDYAHFEKLYETGYVSIQNHTVTHPLSMPSLSASRQLDEMSGQQEKLLKEYGVTPYIFRPPGGN